MAIGDEDTIPETPGARRGRPTPPPIPRDARGYTVDELGRAMDSCTAILKGDPHDPRDLGLRGDVQKLMSEVEALGTDLQGLTATVAAQRPMPRWLQLALVAAALAVGLRAIDATGRERGWWSARAEQSARAEVRR